MKHNKVSESDDEEMLDLQDDPSVQQSMQDMEMLSKSTSRSKRQPLPLLWTRVIDLDQDEEVDIESFEID